MSNENEALDMSISLARDGFDNARSYMTAPADGDAEKLRGKAELMLKSLGIYSRLRATRANEAAITLAAAKMMNLPGEQLAPLWERLTGHKVKPPRLAGAKAR